MIDVLGTLGLIAFWICFIGFCVRAILRPFGGER